MILHLSSCCFIIIFGFLKCQGELLQVPSVSINIDEAGFHRNLLYTVQFEEPLAAKYCEYVLEQRFPSAVYVNVDQLDDFKRLQKLDAIYPKFINIESTTEDSGPFTVLLKLIPKLAQSIKLPIHFRYHAPSDTNTFVQVDIGNPVLYMRCPDNYNALMGNELQATPGTKYCIHEESTSFVEYGTISDNLPIAVDCDWTRMNIEYELKSPLRAKIPIGNEKAFPPVLYATIIASWIVSLWTVFRTNAVPRAINQKLEAQRLLQKKSD